MSLAKLKEKDNLFGIDEYEVTVLRELLRANKPLVRKQLVISSSSGLSRSLRKLVKMELIKREGYHYTIEESGTELLKKVIMYGHQGWENV